MGKLDIGGGNAGLAGRRIIVNTCEGDDVDNWQNPEVDNRELAIDKKREADFGGALARFQGRVTHIYNCHGLTFASRRTQIDDTGEIKKIILQDKYREVKRLAEVLVGDIAVYHTEDRDIDHSGIVVEKGTAPLYIPWVLSKWGFCREVVHLANHCPYDLSDVKYYRFEYK